MTVTLQSEFVSVWPSRWALAAATVAGVLSTKLETIQNHVPACTRALREKEGPRWPVHATVQTEQGGTQPLGGQHPLVCKDGTRLGSVFVTSHTSAKNSTNSDIIITTDLETRVAYDKSSCDRAFVVHDSALVHESSPPTECLVELGVDDIGIHLRRLFYLLPFGIGNSIRRSFVPMDDMATTVQDVLEFCALSVFILTVAGMTWVACAPKWAHGRRAFDEALSDPGLFRAGRTLDVYSAPGGETIVGVVEAGSDVNVVEMTKQNTGIASVDAQPDPTGAVYGRIETPVAGWLVLRSAKAEEPDIQRSFALGVAPQGFEVPDWPQMFAILATMSIGFSLSFRALVVQLLQIMPHGLLAWMTLTYAALFGATAIHLIWIKGCRYIAFQISLSSGMMFDPSPPGLMDQLALWGACGFYVASAIFVVLYVGWAVELWTVWFLLMCNALCLAFFHWKEKQSREFAQDKAIHEMDPEMDPFKNVRDEEPDSTLEKSKDGSEARCKLSSSVGVVPEPNLVVGGRSGTENLMQVGHAPFEADLEEDPQSFSLRDVSWFNSFVTRHCRSPGVWNSRCVQTWPSVIVMLLGCHILLLLGVCMSQYAPQPNLVQLSDSAGPELPAAESSMKFSSNMPGTSTHTEKVEPASPVPTTYSPDSKIKSNLSHVAKVGSHVTKSRTHSSNTSASKVTDSKFKDNLSLHTKLGSQGAGSTTHSSNTLANHPTGNNPTGNLAGGVTPVIPGAVPSTSTSGAKLGFLGTLPSSKGNSNTLANNVAHHEIIGDLPKGVKVNVNVNGKPAHASQGAGSTTYSSNTSANNPTGYSPTGNLTGGVNLVISGAVPSTPTKDAKLGLLGTLPSSTGSLNTSAHNVVHHEIIGNLPKGVKVNVNVNGKPAHVSQGAGSTTYSSNTLANNPTGYSPTGNLTGGVNLVLSGAVPSTSTNKFVHDATVGNLPKGVKVNVKVSVKHHGSNSTGETGSKLANNSTGYNPTGKVDVESPHDAPKVNVKVSVKHHGSNSTGETASL